MTDTNLAFAKLVANPAPTAWSQAYDAGKLFAVLSLQKEDVSSDDPDLLNILGKNILSTLEQEFFTLENKDLDSIKHAIGSATNKIDEGITSSFVIVYLVGNILYLFIYGKGKVVIKRGSKIGTILESKDATKELKSASGYLQDNDLVILQTDDFSKVVPASTLAISLDHSDPKDVAENLAPHIHEKENGAASALFVMYKEDQNFVAALEAQGINPKNGEQEKAAELNFDEEAATEEKPNKEVADDNFEEQLSGLQKPEETQEVPQNEEEKPLNPVGFGETTAYPSRRSFGEKRFSVPRSKRVILSVVVIIIIILGVSTFLAVRNRGNNANKALFAKVYAQAQAKYNEGEGLIDLNKPLAHDSFIAAKKIIDENKNKFDNKSNEEKQLLLLSSKVDDGLSQTSGIAVSKAVPIPITQSAILSLEVKTPDSNYFTQDDKNIFYIDSKGIQSVTKPTSKVTQVVVKGNAWTTEGGLGNFLGNLYVLDKKDGIAKFAKSTASGSANYVRSSYFTGTNPDLSDATAITIDASIYVLFTDGKISKYNRGAPQAFAVTGLDKKLSNPSRIWTDADSTNIYILDNGNSRIVVLTKDGKFKTSYQADELKKAKDFEVLESAKKINFLSGGKAFSISL